MSPPPAQPDPADLPVADPHLLHAIPHGPDLGRPRRVAQGRRVPAVVHRPVAAEQHAAVHIGGQEGLERAAGPAVQFLGVQAGRPAEGGQPDQRGVVAGVVRDGQRPFSTQPDLAAGRFLQLGREGPEPPDREQVKAQQRALAEQGFRGRREHARRHQGRGVTRFGVDQHDIEPGRRGAPGDRRPDDSAARDDDVCDLGHMHSLRRHYPDQVRRSEACGGGALPPSQPRWAPVVS